MRGWLIALGLIGVALAVFAFRLSLRPPDARSLDVDPLPAAHLAGGPADPAPGLVQPQPIRNKADRPKGVELSAGVVPLEERVPSLINDPEFETKYAGWTAEQLEERINVLEPAFQLEMDRLCDLRFQAGQYRVVDASEVEGLDDSYDVLSVYDRQGMLTRSRMVMVETSGVPPAGEDQVPGVEYQLCSLPPETYPELYRQEAELAWLRATVPVRSGSGEEQR